MANRNAGMSDDYLDHGSKQERMREDTLSANKQTILAACTQQRDGMQHVAVSNSFASDSYQSKTEDSMQAVHDYTRSSA